MELLEIGILPLLRLWSELVEAYHKINRYGGDIAEIYAYRFQNNNPILHITDRKQLELITGRQLTQLLRLFCTEYLCTIEVNKMTLTEIEELVEEGCFKFDHRVHVKIMHNK